MFAFTYLCSGWGPVFLRSVCHGRTLLFTLSTRERAEVCDFLFLTLSLSIRPRGPVNRSVYRLCGMGVFFSLSLSLGNDLCPRPPKTILSLIFFKFLTFECKGHSYLLIYVPTDHLGLFRCCSNLLFEVFLESDRQVATDAKQRSAWIYRVAGVTQASSVG